MKILVITAAFPPKCIAGEADHAFHLCKHLADSGIDVHVLTSQGSIAADRAGMTLYPIMRDWSWYDLPRLVRALWRCSPGSVILLYSGGHLYNYHHMITFTPSISKFLAPRARFVTLFENSYAQPSSSILVRALRKGMARWVDSFGTLLRSSDRVIVLSDRQRTMLSKHFPEIVP